MAERRVRQTGKDDDGDITSLCHRGMQWSPRSRAAAINDIETRRHTYYVDEAGTRTEVKIVRLASRKHLQTTADRTSKNNLEALPDC